MEVARPIFVTETGEFCEFGDVNARSLRYPKGFPLSDEEAKRVGLLDYLAAYDKAHAQEIKVEEKAEEKAAQAEEKAVAQAEVEDKAVKGPAEEKAPAAEIPAPDESGEPKTGVDFPLETRRIGGGGRRGSA